MNMSDLRESSPDPLITSWNSSHAMRPSSSPIKPLAVVNSRKNERALRESSPNLPRSPANQQHHTLVFTSPGKGVNGGQSTSPLRIKVTVETEQDEGTDLNRQYTKTTTTKVPLKGEDEHSPAKRRTPRTRMSTSFTSNQSTPRTTLNTRAKGTPRRKRKSSHGVDDTPRLQEQDGDIDAPSHMANQVSPEKPLGKRRKSEGIQELSSRGALAPRRELQTLTPLHEKPENAHLLVDTDIVDCTPFGKMRSAELAATRKIQERVPTPRRVVGRHAKGLGSVPSHAAMEETLLGRDLFADSTSEYHVGDSLPDLQSGDETSDDLEGIEDDTAILDRSLADSEGFSMVSIESLRNQHLLSEANSGASVISGNDRTTLGSDLIVDPDTRNSCLTALQRGDATHKLGSTECGTSAFPERSSFPQISHFASSEKDVSKELPKSSTKVISLRMRNEALQQTPGKLRDTDEEKLPGPKAASTPQQILSCEEPFNNFGSGTKRQLSAGLAMGELLARGERNFTKTQITSHEKEAISPQVDIQPECVALFSRLPTPEDTASVASSLSSPTVKTTDETSKEEHDENDDEDNDDNESFPRNIHDAQRSSSNGTIRRPTTPPGTLSYSPELSRTEEQELRWQRERDDVVRQAGEANSSQIVHIESDSEPSGDSYEDNEECQDVDMTESGDIWQEEAERSLEESSSSQSLSTSRSQEMKPKDETQDLLRDLLGEDSRPLRGKLPRTWRRNSGSHFLYNDEADSPVRPQDVSQRLQGGSFDRALWKEGSDARQSRKAPEETELAESSPIGILRSPDKRERQQSATPKEVRFTEEKQIQTDTERNDLNNADVEYFSSDHFTESNRRGHDSDSLYHGISSEEHDICHPERSTSNEDEQTESKASNFRLFKRESRSMATPYGGTLLDEPTTLVDGSRLNGKSMLVLKPYSNGKYTRLFDDPPRSMKKRNNTTRSDPNLARHIESAQTIRIEAFSANSATPAQGIFSRLSSWLYPPIPSPDSPQTYAYDWNRNHYLVLNHYWNQHFQSPEFVEPIHTELHAQERDLQALPSELRSLISARITRFNGKQPLVLSLAHCVVASHFMAESQDSGIPLLCDGRRRVPKHLQRPSAYRDSASDSSEDEENQWPKRDALGRIIRVKQNWTANEALKGVYGLWLIKTSEAARTKTRAPMASS